MYVVSGEQTQVTLKKANVLVFSLLVVLLQELSFSIQAWRDI